MKTKGIFTIILMCLFSINIQAQSYRNSEDLSDEERATLEQRVIEKINDFLSYLPEIAAKSNKSEEEKKLARKYIGLTLDLFIGEGKKYQYQDNAGVWRWHDEVKMQTTSRGRANTPKPMATYLERLMALPYQKVEIDTCSAVRINKKLYKQADGQYTGSAVFIQAFRATRDGRLVVNDKDAKQVTIYVKREEIEVNGQTDTVWIIKLGDIRITTEWSN